MSCNFYFLRTGERRGSMYLWITKLSVTSMLLAGIVFFNQSMLDAEQNKSPHYEKGIVRIATKGGKTGTINWKTRYITSKGIAVTTSNTTNSSQNRLLARRGAIVDAQRNLLETIDGVRIDSTTTVSDHMTNDEIRSSVKGTLKNFEIIDEKWDGEVYEITMHVTMGKIYKVFKKPENSALSDRKPAQPLKQEHTGLVIDARGLNLVPAIFVNIYKEDGVKICGPIHPVYRVSVKSINNVKEERIGTNPLRIAAKNTTGPNNVDLVVGKKNLKGMKQMLFGTDIFSKNRVVILID